MAERRMFAKQIVESDAFIDMPLSTQALYFHYGMLADDEGFVNSPKKTQRMIGASDDDLKLLIAKRFILPFESGIIVLKHWKINNYIQKDRFKETLYKNEKNQLIVKENGAYTECIQNVSNMYTQNSIGKDRLDKVSIDIPLLEESSRSDTAKANTKHKYGQYKNVLLKDEELQALQKDYSNWEELIKYLDEYIEMKGYKAKSHYLCIKKWVVDAVKRSSTKTAQIKQLNNYKQREYNDLDRLYTNLKKE